MTPKEVYMELIKSYNKATEMSLKWNELNKEIIERERIYSNNLGLSVTTFFDRVTDVKEKSKELSNLYNSYSFWKGEVERHSSMLTGVLAFEEYQDRSSSI